MTKRSQKSASGYEVGYRKPPTHSQFKKGASGNPRGRPRITTTVGATLQDIALRKIRVFFGGKSPSITTLEAMLLQLTKRALTGDPKAIKLFVELIRDEEICVPPPIEVRVKYVDPKPEPYPSSSSSE